MDEPPTGAPKFARQLPYPAYVRQAQAAALHHPQASLGHRTLKRVIEPRGPRPQEPTKLVLLWPWEGVQLRQREE